MCCVKFFDSDNELDDQLGGSLQDGSDNCFGQKRREGDDMTELQFDVPGIGCGGCYVGSVGMPGDTCP